ncbi:alpha-2,8-polysialyltransferase family protein [Streptomyces sp. N2-109]|uniref:Alpha-2,8-polysialyltransferase family protein n=1 Tax=Streptomyces gossypii TaxID=2883101 RepID=A0ABT2JXZ4_9ACTN|nr:alpha-2,8-polysialyltransferase family protein [Streptomyces gossypii]MCT2592711.1 alpha-2,8-polysialyltransferase family protein [Streptomyces gossypii]
MANTPNVPRPVQIFEVSTLYGAATVAAALDAGQFGPRDAARRILLVSNNASVPETATALPLMSGFEGLAARFDETRDWNAMIRPHHPGGWMPRLDDAPLWERVLRLGWGLGDAQVELVVESLHAGPARALTAIFGGSTIHVYADGLMSYGPTRDRLPYAVGRRVERLLHLDLVPGLRPMLLSEYGVRAETVLDDAFRRVLAELGEAAASDPALTRAARSEPTAVLLGQYLAALDILTQEEEEQLHLRMLHGAVAAGHDSVLFKPHPSAPASYSRALEKTAAEAGIRLTVLDRPLLAEAVYERCRPSLVVGCFSTAMLTAATYYGVPIAKVGTEVLLRRLRPYQNSNRVPVTLVDFLVADLERGETPTAEVAVPTKRADDAGALLRTVGYCMQAELHPGLREDAASWLTERLDGTTEDYFSRKRLTALELPGRDNSARAQLLRRVPALGRISRRAGAARSGAE